MLIAAMEPIATIDGPAEIREVDPSTWQVWLSGQKLFEKRGAIAVAPVTQWPAAGPAITIVLRLDYGAVACPAEYVAIKIGTLGAIPQRSTLFGNCSDVPVLSYAGAATLISFPQHQAAGAEVWRLSNGALMLERRDELVGSPDARN